jgi:beta-glucosidase
MGAKLFCWLFACVMFGLLFAVSVQAQNKALDPVDRKDDWWVKRHAESVEKMNEGNIDLLLIGDSITHGWEDQPELYEKFFGEYKKINLGFSGDQTAHVLWRLDHLPLDKISPKAAMILIGTNNIGHQDGTTPKEAAEGIVAIVEKLQKQYPKIRIIVMKVFPRDEKPEGEYREKVNKLNVALHEQLSKNAQTFDYVKRTPNTLSVDITHAFLVEDGTLSKRILPDFLHLSEEGYELWGNHAAQTIKKAFQQYDLDTPLGNLLRSLF